MKLKAFLESQPPRFWAWSVTVAVLLLLAMAFGGSLLFSSDSHREASLASGQRVLVDLNTGAVEGRIISLAPAPETLPPELPATETPTEAEPPVEEPPSAAPSESAETAPAETEPQPQTEAASPESAQTPSEEVATPTMPAARIPPRENPEVSESELAPPASVAAIQPAEVLPSDVLPQVDPQLSEHTESGLVLPLPAGGSKPSVFYARPFERKEKRPVIAIALTGLGFSKSITEMATLLPGAISLVFSPYAKESAIWIGNSRSRGHEVWVEAPMEPMDFPASDPGPKALIANISIKENIDRLHWVLSRFPGFTGIYSPKNEVVTLNDALMKAVIEELNHRGVTLMVGNTTGNPGRNELLRAHRDIAFLPDFVLGDDVSSDSLKLQLEEAEALAKKQGSALLVVRAYPSILQTLDAWYRTLPAKGIDLAPASAIPALRH